MPPLAADRFPTSLVPCQPWPTHQVRLTFGPQVPMAEVEGTLQLARIAAESVHGEGRVELAAACCVDPPRREVRIDTTSAVGRTLGLVFLGYVRREFGRDKVTVERVRPGRACARGSAA